MSKNLKKKESCLHAKARVLVTGAADLVNRLGVGEDALWAIPVVLGVLALASTVTVIQRVLVVRDQARALAAEAESGA